jgi:putative transposase
LDRLLIVDEHHLRPVLTEYLRHYTAARPHRALGQRRFLDALLKVG